MNWNILNSIDRENRVPNTVAFLALVAIAGLVGVAVIGGGAAAAEPLNETVEVDNTTGEVYAQVTFNDSISDSAATADVTVTDPNGSVFATATVTGSPGDTVVEEWPVNDSAPTGNFSVVVTADAGVVDDSEAGTFLPGAGGGGGSGGSSDGWGSYMGVPIFVIAIVALAGVVYAVREGWHEDLL